MNIYVLYTGGTIGGVGNPLSPMQGSDFISAFESVVEPLIILQMRGVTFKYDWLECVLDSTNMQPSDWVTMAQKILRNYIQNDAFLILHGTDTMAWTSSALSFLLPGIAKPVFFTGSQLPLFYQQESAYTLFFNTDALRNILGAIQFMTFGIPEVAIYFADSLMRGNRVVKSNSSQLAAFSSPNYATLGSYGVTPALNDNLIFNAPSVDSLATNIQKATEDLDQIANTINLHSVIQFVLFPAYYNANTGDSLLVSMLMQLQCVSPPLKGIIFESFGEGNIPDFPQMRSLLADFNSRGIIMVDCTQVYSGEVKYNVYATGAWLKTVGVISGLDMTPIAALTKLIVLLALNLPALPSEIQKKMSTNLAGEMAAFFIDFPATRGSR